MDEQLRTPRRHRRWNWLLAIPLVLLIYPGLYARNSPVLLGFPFFYWYQFAVVALTALLTAIVYLKTRDGEDHGDDHGNAPR